MANFAIAADETVIAKGNQLIEELQEPGEKKGTTLNRLFDLVTIHLQEDRLKKSGLDTEALDASITNIRNLFATALSGREELRAEYEQRINELRCKNEELEKAYKSKIEKLSLEKEELLKKYNEKKALQEADHAARESAEEQAASAANLIKEKDKTNIMLMEKLQNAEQKAASYDELKQQLSDLEKASTALQIQLKDYEKEKSFHMQEISHLKEEKERLDALMKNIQEKQQAYASELSEKSEQIAKIEKEKHSMQIQFVEQMKEAELAKERAVIEKEREILAKAEALRTSYDTVKEENYRLKLQIAKTGTDSQQSKV